MDIIAEVYLLTSEERGYEAIPIFNERSFNYVIDGWCGSIHSLFVDTNLEMLLPGEKTELKLVFQRPDVHEGKLSVGYQFDLTEGSRKVGTAIVKEVLNPALIKNSEG